MSNIVYTVHEEIRYEGGVFVGVASSLRRAKEIAEEHTGRRLEWRQPDAEWRTSSGLHRDTRYADADRYGDDVITIEPTEVQE